MNMMNVNHAWIWWMSIIYDVGTSYYGCQSYMMDVHHIWGITVISDAFPSNMWTSFLMKSIESFSRRNKKKRYGGFFSNDGNDGMGSERMYGIYGTDWNNGAGER